MDGLVKFALLLVDVEGLDQTIDILVVRNHAAASGTMATSARSSRAGCA
jgi:hypothetical protein